MGFITEPNRGDYLIQLKKDRSKTSNDVIDEIRVKVLTASTTSRFWSSYWRYVSDLMSSVSPIEVKVLETTRKNYKKIAKQVAQIRQRQKVPLMYLMELYAGPSISA
jgi:hypothetical protein